MLCCIKIAITIMLFHIVINFKCDVYPVIKSPSTSGKRFYVLIYVLAKVQSFHGRDSEKSSWKCEMQHVKKYIYV